MILIDTSVWIALHRDRTGGLAQHLSSLVGEERVATADSIIGEVVQGTCNASEWAQLEKAMLDLEQLPMNTDTWIQGARIFYDLQRNAVTVRSTIDCCVAQLAITHSAKHLHMDRDFDAIARVRQLDHFHLKAGTP